MPRTPTAEELRQLRDLAAAAADLAATLGAEAVHIDGVPGGGYDVAVHYDTGAGVAPADADTFPGARCWRIGAVALYERS